MFGLLKTTKITSNQHIDFRLNYCGTCTALYAVIIERFLCYKKINAKNLFFRSIDLHLT